MNAKLILAVTALSQSVEATSIMIDLDLNTPGVQNSITNAVEGQVVNFALVATNFTGDIHCFNGIGGDISSRGSMSVSYNPVLTVGEIAGFTNEGVGHFRGTNPADPNGGPTPILSVSPYDSVFTSQLAPLSGYTNNVGGFGIEDPGNNWDANFNVVSFRNVPGGSVPYTTIFMASMTLTNVSGSSLDLFPSGVFVNPPSQTSPGGVTLPFGSGSAFLQQDGEIYLHDHPHMIDNQCVGLGSGSLVGASISGIGIPEPSSVLLIGLSGLGLIFHRRRK